MSPGDLYLVGGEKKDRGMVEILRIGPTHITYFYHMAWPTRNEQEVRYATDDTLHQVTTGWWSFYDPALQVSEGL